MNEDIIKLWKKVGCPLYFIRQVYYECDCDYDIAFKKIREKYPIGFNTINQ